MMRFGFIIMLIKKIASDLRLPVQYIELVSASASHRYKTYKIKKRTSGYRTIDHPARELKLLQRWLVENLFSSFPVHDAVHSYRIGRSILSNAILHRNNNYLLRADFANFFPSILAQDVARLILNNRDTLPFQLSKRDIFAVTSLVCKQGSLTVGAPALQHYQTQFI